ncbi:unnamed protein product, partial [Musa acuminata var. zebrina]
LDSHGNLPRISTKKITSDPLGSSFLPSVERTKWYLNVSSKRGKGFTSPEDLFSKFSVLLSLFGTP